MTGYSDILYGVNSIDTMRCRAQEHSFKPHLHCPVSNTSFGSIWFSMVLVGHGFINGQFQVTVFSRFCYVLLCNHEYIHCLNHRQAKDYITRRNETDRKL